MNQEELKQRLIELVQSATIEMNYCTSDGIPIVTTEKHIVDEREVLPLINYLIANDVTIRERGEWIPVTERLPEAETLVLCIGARGGMFLGFVRTLYGDGTAYAYVPNSRGGRNATHWRPLPEPPETEKGGVQE